MEIRKSQSDEIGLISLALSKAQGTYKTPIANQDAIGGPYANLRSIIDAVKESLSKNEIAYRQHVEYLEDGSGSMILHTEISHSSNQWFKSHARLIRKETDRATNNDVENHKRVQLSTLLGVAPVGNDPWMKDDNFEASSFKQTLEESKKPKTEKKLNRQDVISKERYQDLMIECDNYPEFVKSVLNTYDIETIADLPNEEYLNVKREVVKMKKAESEWRKSKGQ